MYPVGEKNMYSERYGLSFNGISLFLASFLLSCEDSISRTGIQLVSRDIEELRVDFAARMTTTALQPRSMACDQDAIGIKRDLCSCICRSCSSHPRILVLGCKNSVTMSGFIDKWPIFTLFLMSASGVRSFPFLLKIRNFESQRSSTKAVEF